MKQTIQTILFITILIIHINAQNNENTNDNSNNSNNQILTIISQNTLFIYPLSSNCQITSSSFPQSIKTNQKITQYIFLKGKESNYVIGEIDLTNTNVEEIIIEDGYTQIQNYAFIGISKQSSVIFILPNTLEKLGRCSLSCGFDSIKQTCEKFVDEKLVYCGIKENFQNCVSDELLCAVVDDVKVSDKYQFKSFLSKNVTVNDTHCDQPYIIIEKNNVGNSILSVYGKGIITRDTVMNVLNEFEQQLQLKNQSIYMNNSNVDINGNENKKLYVFDELIIHDGIWEIDSLTFSYIQIKQISLGKTIRKIGENAFSNNEYVTEIILPSSVVTIGKQAFQNCKSLKYLTLPYLIETIPNDILHGCESMKEIVYNGKSDTIQGGNMTITESITIQIKVLDTRYDDSTFGGYSVTKLEESEVFEQVYIFQTDVLKPPNHMDCIFSSNPDSIGFLFGFGMILLTCCIFLVLLWMRNCQGDFFDDYFYPIVIVSMIPVILILLFLLACGIGSNIVFGTIDETKVIEEWTTEKPINVTIPIQMAVYSILGYICYVLSVTIPLFKYEPDKHQYVSPMFCGITFIFCGLCSILHWLFGNHFGSVYPCVEYDDYQHDEELYSYALKGYHILFYTIVITTIICFLEIIFLISGHLTEEVNFWGCEKMHNSCLKCKDKYAEKWSYVSPVIEYISRNMRFCRLRKQVKRNQKLKVKMKSSSCFSCCKCCKKIEIPPGMKMENGVLVHDLKCEDVSINEIMSVSEMSEVVIENI